MRRRFRAGSPMRGRRERLAGLAAQASSATGIWPGPVSRYARGGGTRAPRPAPPRALQVRGRRRRDVAGPIDAVPPDSAGGSSQGRARFLHRPPIDPRASGLPIHETARPFLADQNAPYLAPLGDKFGTEDLPAVKKCSEPRKFELADPSIIASAYSASMSVSTYAAPIVSHRHHTAGWTNQDLHQLPRIGSNTSLGLRHFWLAFPLLCRAVPKTWKKDAGKKERGSGKPPMINTLISAHVERARVHEGERKENKRRCFDA